MGKKIERVMIYVLGSLGDMVVALPAFHMVEKAFPDAERRMLTNFPVSAKAPAAAAVLADNGLVHGYLRYTIKTRSLKVLFGLWWSIVRWRPQVLVYIGPPRGVAAAKRDALFFRLCGISTQIGVPVTEDMQKYQFLQSTQALEGECQRLVRNIAELGDSAIDTPEAWDLRLTAAEKLRAQQALQPADGRPVLAVSVGTKVQCKDWGRENWQALLARIGAKYPHYALAMMGVREESEASEFAAEGWRRAAGPDSPVINLCGVLSPRESAACFAQSRIFVGHDSGPMHLAAAVGTTCVAIFTARAIPRVWYPYGEKHRVIYHDVSCRNCGLETCIVEKKRCITSITVDEVMTEVEAVLG